MRKMAYLLPIIALCSFLAVHTFSTAAFAVTSYRLEAATQNPQEWSSFSVVWTDEIVEDGLLQLGEEKEFSGVFYFGVFSYEQISVVPGYDASESPFTGGSGTVWEFTGTGGITLPPPDRTNWDYTRSVVPLPASALLLGSGLLGLGLLGWRKKR